MSKKPLASLGSFVASKVDAAPAALYREPPKVPANNDEVQAAQPVAIEVSAPKVKAKPVEPPVRSAPVKMVTLNLLVEKTFRHELKQYAIGLDKSVIQIVREALALHREKHAKANDRGGLGQ